eukprot:Lankesteria_metandrocarpae@DN1518_c0_g1_i3.p1
MAPPSKAPSSELGVVCLDLRSKDGSERATVEMRVPSASGAYDAVMKRYMAIFDPKKSKRQTRADAPYRSHAEPKIWRQQIMVVVAQILQPILVQDEGESECVQECADYVPDIIPVDVFIPKPVHAPAEVGGNFTEHAEVQIPVTQWNGLLDRLNPHLDQTAKELLPYRQVTSAVQLMTNN